MGLAHASSCLARPSPMINKTPADSIKRKNLQPECLHSVPTPKEEPTDHSDSVSHKSERTTQSKKRKISADDTAAEEGPTAERQHSSAEVSSKTNEKVAKKFTKHPVHWLIDGNVLVQIGEIRFRLHRSTLLKQSGWFRRIIASENPPRDLCICVDEKTRKPVYCLDSLDIDVTDFATLLDALEDAISYNVRDPPLRTVASILRASDTLEFVQFKEYALDYLSRHWELHVDTVNTKKLKYAIDVLTLAQERNITSVLKRAFYEIVRSEGFCQEVDRAEGSQTDGSEQDNPVRPLDAKNYKILVNAREKLTAFWMQQAAPPAELFVHDRDIRDRSCVALTGYVDGVYRVLVHDSRIFSMFKYDPICGLTALINAPWGAGEAWNLEHEGIRSQTPVPVPLCPLCCQRMRNRWRAEKQALWKDLETWLELISTP